MRRPSPRERGVAGPSDDSVHHPCHRRPRCGHQSRANSRLRSLEAIGIGVEVARPMPAQRLQAIPGLHRRGKCQARSRGAALPRGQQSAHLATAGAAREQWLVAALSPPAAPQRYLFSFDVVAPERHIEATRSFAGVTLNALRGEAGADQPGDDLGDLDPCRRLAHGHVIEIDELCDQSRGSRCSRAAAPSGTSWCR